MRKYLFNAGVLGSIVGAWPVLKATRQGPRDWRLILTWVAWLATFAVAIAAVRDESAEALESQKRN